MKKVSGLTGTELDYWVGRAEGRKKGHLPYVAYSTVWNVGGPIIEREHIRTRFVKRGYIAGKQFGKQFANQWMGEYPVEPFVSQIGETLLLAAMRCFVASRFGDTVDDSQTHNL